MLEKGSQGGESIVVFPSFQMKRRAFGEYVTRNSRQYLIKGGSLSRIDIAYSNVEEGVDHSSSRKVL